jgi:hypothetical protein
LGAGAQVISEVIGCFAYQEKIAGFRFGPVLKGVVGKGGDTFRTWAAETKFVINLFDRDNDCT